MDAPQLDFYPQPLQAVIRDFKGISETGVFSFSGDSVTILAGQNEAGKTSVLQALFEFDKPAGVLPSLDDYEPDFKEGARPRVAVKFSITKEFLDYLLSNESIQIPKPAYEKILSDGTLWVFRILPSGTYQLTDQIAKLWSGSDFVGAAPRVIDSQDASKSVNELTKPISGEFLATLRNYWPTFVYFDSFADVLPKTVPLARPPSMSDPELTSTLDKVMSELPQTVKDFLRLADIDIKKIWQLEGNHRELGNFLKKKETRITTDFLAYWKQKHTKQTTLSIRAAVHNASNGDLQMSFYINDGTDQYPAQRSTGFLWFLSFYLRLAASCQERGRPYLILIDEPGSYLHPKAQKDILHFLEKSVVTKNSNRVVYTTHSQHLLPADRLHRVKIVAKSEKEGTFVADKLTDPRLKASSFDDALSPVFASIGLDLSDQLRFRGDRSLIVEGVSDFIYLHTFASLLNSELFKGTNIYPGSGAPSVIHLVSLTIGWGAPFCVLLDHDEEGAATTKKLIEEMSIDASVVARPVTGSIEDVFSPADFQTLLDTYSGETMKMTQGERSSAAIKRLGVNKILLARKFAEMHHAGSIVEANITAKTRAAIEGLLANIEKAFAQWTNLIKQSKKVGSQSGASDSS